jgi:hypothetical protein
MHLPAMTLTRAARPVRADRVGYLSVCSQCDLDLRDLRHRHGEAMKKQRLQIGDVVKEQDGSAALGGRNSPDEI